MFSALHTWDAGDVDSGGAVGWVDVCVGWELFGIGVWPFVFVDDDRYSFCDGHLYPDDEESVGVCERIRVGVVFAFLYQLSL